MPEPQPENPYEQTVLADAVVSVDPPPGRRETAAILTVLGFVLGPLLGGVGYMLIVFLLEMLAVPPLKSASSYGQFGFLPLNFAFVGFCCGLSFGLIPYARFGGWLPVFCLIVYFTLNEDIASQFDPREVTNMAMVLLGVATVAIAFGTSRIVRQRTDSDT